MKTRNKVLAALSIFLLSLTMLPVTAFADDPVAQIGTTTYDSLDDAVLAAANGDTITVLKSTTISKLNLRNSNYGGVDKDLTITGAEGVNPTITFTDAGIQTSSHTLTLEDCQIIMNDLQAPNVSWGTIFFDTGGVMNLNRVTMTLDGTNAPSGGTNAIYTHGIYFYGSNTLNITDSNVTIQNYPQDALEWSGDYPDGNRATYDLNVKNSTFICDKNRSGLAGTFDMKIDNSIVKVTDSTGNGSNGTYYTITNQSDVQFTGNRNWGISAYRIDMSDNSTLTACDNGYSGVWTRILNVDGTSTLDVERNGAKSTGYTTNAGIFFQGNGSYTSTIDKGANVTIKNNAGCGIYTNQSVCNLTINTDAVITNNGTGEVDANKHGAKYGGGVYNVGTMVLCDDVVIYNNHADEAGDDIYSNGTKSITFGNVNSNGTWILDDCNHQIDGWYEDGYEQDDVDDPLQRWSANCEDEGYTYTRLKESGNYTTTIAYKAAHGLDPTSGNDNSKISYPDLEKWIATVDNGEVTATASNASAAAGDTVYFELVSLVPDTLYDYINYSGSGDHTNVIVSGEVKDGATYILTFHDTLDSDLALDSDSIIVKIGDTVLENQDNVTYYTVTSTGLSDNCTFEVSIDLLKLYSAGIITEDDFAVTSITVLYAATLSDAATAGTYHNTAYVTYKEGTSEEKEVTVKTYGILIYKYDQSTLSSASDASPSTAEPLQNAVFTLTKPDGSTVTLTTDQTGYASLEGLDAGTYTLEETKAPSNYVHSDKALTIVIPDEVDANTLIATVYFANAPIPSTGGTGTRMYLIGGACLIAAAGTVFVVSRRKKDE